MSGTVDTDTFVCSCNYAVLHCVAANLVLTAVNGMQWLVIINVFFSRLLLAEHFLFLPCVKTLASLLLVFCVLSLVAVSISQFVVGISRIDFGEVAQKSQASVGCVVHSAGIVRNVGLGICWSYGAVLLRASSKSWLAYCASEIF